MLYKHLPSDKRVINRKPFRFVQDTKGRSVAVIHGRIGSDNHKAYKERV